MSDVFTARAFGCRWTSDLPLYAFAPDELSGADPDEAEGDITVRLCEDPVPYRGESVSTTRLRHVEGGSRFLAGDTATLDSFGGQRVEVRPGSQWDGKLPVEFFGTLAGVLLSWRGALAMHGSAVELNDGRGVLICGRSGAGKSTLAAALLVEGARLISDDLSILRFRRAQQAPVLFTGRKTMRLFPDVAHMLGERVAWEQAPGMADGKMLVTPPRVDAAKAVPLTCLLILGASLGELEQEERASATEDRLELLQRQMFRPLAYARIPGFPLRLDRLSSVAKEVPVRMLKEQQARNRNELADLAAKVTRLLDALPKPIQPSSGSVA